MLKTRAKYSLGQIVRHRKHPFRGVVFDVDAMFSNTEEWYDAIPETSLFITCSLKTTKVTMSLMCQSRT